ncbi:hypothetical protein [Trichormus azollae]|uniref:hypothetical protein n=1 Tax=Trichormus azollae TaxID=1164 RepID=UPI003D34F414
MVARFSLKFVSKLPGISIKLRPCWYYYLEENAVLEDNQILLHYQERYVEAKVAVITLLKPFI